LPTLRPGDIVVMDNFGSHKSKVVRQLIRSAGAKLLFLQKCSPHLNPIEQVFAKLKHLIRRPPHEPSMRSAQPLDKFCQRSLQKNAPTTSKMQAIKP
jgi:transposase